MTIPCSNCSIDLELDDTAAAEPFDCPSCGSFNDPPKLRPDGTPCIIMRPRPDIAALNAVKAGTAPGGENQPLWVLISLVVAFVVVGAIIAARGEPMAWFEGLVTSVAFVGSILLYFLPTLIASRREHRNLVAIGALNLFLGWTLIGWVVALVWSLLAASDSPVPAHRRL